jgi:hypothetical protein
MAATSLLPSASDDALAWTLQFFAVWLLGLACAWLVSAARRRAERPQQQIAPTHL